MQITFDIDDARLAGFSAEATISLKKSCKEYASMIVDEAKRIEQTDRLGSGQVEVIASHIGEAIRNYRKPASVPKWKIVVDIIVEILLLLLGCLFDKGTLLDNNLFLTFYVGLVIVTVALLVIKYARGGPI